MQTTADEAECPLSTHLRPSAHIGELCSAAWSALRPPHRFESGLGQEGVGRGRGMILTARISHSSRRFTMT